MRPTRLNADELFRCRALWESGVTVAELSEEFSVSERTIKRYRAREKWVRGAGGATDTALQKAKNRVEEKIDRFVEQEEMALKAAVAKTMTACRESVTEVLARHKTFSTRLASVMEREISALENNPDPNPSKRLTHIKTATDVVASIQRIERKTWGIDDRASSSDLDQILMEIENEEDRRANSGELN